MTDVERGSRCYRSRRELGEDVSVECSLPYAAAPCIGESSDGLLKLFPAKVRSAPPIAIAEEGQGIRNQVAKVFTRKRPSRT